MSGSQLVLSGAAFLFALILGLGAMPVAYSLGHRFDMVSHPRLFGQGASAVSRLGGLAVAASVVVVLLPLLFLADGLIREVGALLVGAVVLLVLGVIDDKAKDKELSPYLRLAVEACVAGGVWIAGAQATPTGNPWVDGPLTVFFLVAATNSFNLLDNMDGVAGSCAATVAAGLFALAGLSGQYLVAILAAATLGASLAFLRHNLVSARVYLGNGGSMFLGFLIAATTLKLRLPLAQPWSYLAAIAVLIVPAADTSLVILSRRIARRPLMTGGVDHLSHRLVALGFSTRTSALAHSLASAVGAATVAAAIVLRRNEPLVVISALFVALTLGLLRVAVYEVESPSLVANSENPEFQDGSFLMDDLTLAADLFNEEDRP